VFGIVNLEKESFDPGDFFLRGMSCQINTFWEVVEGARLGVEAIWGKRVDVDFSHGNALRFNLLFYYDL